MSNYAARGAAPETLTADEQRRVLAVSGADLAFERDHLIIAFALGTGAREHEIAALDLFDVVLAPGERGSGADELCIRSRVELPAFKGAARADARRRREQVVVLPFELRRKLDRYVRLRLQLDPLRAREQGQLRRPLFSSERGQRIATRSIRWLWAKWQRLAGFERQHPFHRLRHTFCSNLHEASGGNVALVKRLARHRRIETTSVYVHVSDERITAAVGRMKC